jgi:hypothetical protein
LGEIAVADRLRTVDGLVLYNPDAMDFYTYKAMRKDDQVKASLALKKFAILSTPWTIKAAGSNPLAKKQAEFINYALLRIEGAFESKILGILTAMDFGFSVSEIVWTLYSEGPYNGWVGVDDIKAKSPQDITFSTDRYGNLSDILQFGKSLWGQVPGTTTTQPPQALVQKFIVYSYMEEFSNPYGIADLRAAYRPWWLKENTLRWTGMLLERYGIPPWVAYYDRAKLTNPEFEALKKVIDNAQAATAMLVPNLIKFEFPQVVMSGADIFLRTVTELDSQIARAILLPQQLGYSSERRYGSFAKAEIIFGLFLWVLSYMRRTLTETVIGPKLIKPLIDYNFGVQAEYPALVWSPLTQEVSTELMNLFLSATEKGVLHPTPMDEDTIRESLGMPPLTEPIVPGEVLPTEQADSRLRTLLSRQRDELVRFVEATGQTNDLRLKFLRDIQLVFRELLRSSMGNGKGHDFEQLRVIEDRATEATSRLRTELAEKVKIATTASGDGKAEDRIRKMYESYVMDDALTPHIDEMLRAARRKG